MEVVGFYMFGSGLKSNLVYMCGLQAAQLTFDYIWIIFWLAVHGKVSCALNALRVNAQMVVKSIYGIILRYRI